MNLPRWWRAERGSISAEMTLVAPLLVLLLVFVGVLVHRGVDTRLRLDDAAHQAARAATLQRTSGAATRAAHTTVVEALAAAGVTCRAVHVTTDTVGLTPGGSVTVRAACTIDLAEAILLGVPGTKELQAIAVEPVDTWRGTTRPFGGGET